MASSDPQIKAGDHLSYLRHALSLARLSPPRPTNFRVGALLVDPHTNAILASGFTLELPGNTHAEQCALAKLAAQHSVPVDRVGEVLPQGAVLYTTMEPCNFRASGNVCCVDRILDTRKTGGGAGIVKVYSGVKEPEKFVGENKGRARLEAAGVEFVHVTGLEEEILEVATAGHETENESKS